MNQAASLGWFARHELLLAWRDWAALMSGGLKLKNGAILLGMAVIFVALHALAYAVAKPFFVPDAPLGPARLVLITSALFLTFTMMLSQAMESVTRAFYSRDDLDLILSSPASSQSLFAVRISIMALTTALMSGLMVTPFINVGILLDGPRWLAAYGVVFAISGFATGAAVLITLGLFKSIGAKRTRLVAQIAAAVVGAAFLIGLQVVGIISYGTLSRWDVINSSFVLDLAPHADSVMWLPAHAVAGDVLSLLVLFFVATLFFAFAMMRGAKQFRQIVVAALGVADDAVVQGGATVTFKRRSTHGAIMRKELQLLARDPWLLSQTLMQMLYLVPPALMMWVSFGSRAEVSVIIAPVIVMAIGQLAGGLAWLAISGEDAPDLVATAPISPGALIASKVKTVMMIVVAIALPFVLAISLLTIWGALVLLAGVVAAALSATFIQLCFRAQAKRANFRRRQVASRTSTICEAFASILCAGATALCVAGNALAIVPMVLTLVVLSIAWFAGARDS